jgi:hypothetical protein
MPAEVHDRGDRKLRPVVAGELARDVGEQKEVTADGCGEQRQNMAAEDGTSRSSWPCRQWMGLGRVHGPAGSRPDLEELATLPAVDGTRGSSRPGQQWRRYGSWPEARKTAAVRRSLTGYRGRAGQGWWRAGRVATAHENLAMEGTSVTRRQHGVTEAHRR